MMQTTIKQVIKTFQGNEQLCMNDNVKKEQTKGLFQLTKHTFRIMSQHKSSISSTYVSW